MNSSKFYLGNKLETWRGQTGRWYARVRKAIALCYDISYVAQADLEKDALDLLKLHLAKIAERHRSLI